MPRDVSLKRRNETSSFREFPPVETPSLVCGEEPRVVEEEALPLELYPGEQSHEQAWDSACSASSDAVCAYCRGGGGTGSDTYMEEVASTFQKSYSTMNPLEAARYTERMWESTIGATERIRRLARKRRAGASSDVDSHESPPPAWTASHVLRHYQRDGIYPWKEVADQIRVLRSVKTLLRHNHLLKKNGNGLRVDYEALNKVIQIDKQMNECLKLHQQFINTLPSSHEPPRK